MDDFADVMRSQISTRFPKLSSSFRHALENGSSDDDNVNSPLDLSEQWDADASNARLAKAYEQGGAEGWIKAAWKEGQMELEVWNRRKRQ